MFGAGIALYFLLPGEPGLVAPCCRPLPRWPCAWSRARRHRRRADGGAAGRVAGRGGGQAAHGGGARAGAAEADRSRRCLRLRRAGRAAGDAGTAPHASASPPWRSTRRTSGRTRVRVRTHGARTRDLAPGDAVRLKATLSPPPGPSLPGDYDFARAAWFQGLGAVGYATAAPARIDAKPPSRRCRCALSAAVARVRQAIGRRVVEALPGQTGAIANALITGERGGISEATNQAFRDSGPVPHPLDLRPAHGDHGGRGVRSPFRLLLAAVPAGRAALPDQEVGGGGRHGGRVRLPHDLGGRVRHRALLHHDLHHVPGCHARPPGGGAAQRGAGGAGDPGGVAREPVRCRLPDVVCGRRGAGLGLRVAARARRGARERDDARAGARCAACSSAASSPRR